MGLRGPHARPLPKPPAAPKGHVTYQLSCWECRWVFAAKRIDTMYCSASCKQQAYRRRQFATQQA